MLSSVINNSYLASPETKAVELTSSLASGLTVPIPTLPSCLTTNLSTNVLKVPVTDESLKAFPDWSFLNLQPIPDSSKPISVEAPAPDFRCKSSLGLVSPIP